MKYWQKNRNYRKYQNEDGTFRHVIFIDGEDVEVSAEVYRAYSQADRRERYCYEREEGLLLSLERMDEDNVPLSSLTDKHMESAEDTAIREILHSKMAKALDKLSDDERFLIEQLFLEEISARELARMSGVYHRTITYRRDKILEKLMRLMNE